VKIPKEFQPNESVLPYVAKTIAGFGELYNGYKIKGLKNIPEGGALIVMYHGLVPLDFWYFGLKLYLETGRVPAALVDRWLMKMPGLAWLTRAVGGVSADYKVAVQLLKSGQLVGVSPGGTREAISGAKNNYKLIWGKRQGFAKLALEAGVPIIPGFTQNIEGLYHAPFADHKFFQNLFEKTRLPLVPIIGLGPFPFPVKLTTWLGAALLPVKGETAEKLAARTQGAIEELISSHQK
jgi:1-acyl-sn-glycerol-3-phosphate acyltransferase